MAVDVVIGGQGGDEGKGKIAAYLGLHGDYSIALRISSPQAGHSIHYNGKRFGIAHIPCSVINPKLRLLLGGASFISPKVIYYGGKETRPHTGEEIEITPEIPSFRLTPERLGIDYRAKLVTDKHKKWEQENQHLMKKIGSVGSGVNGAKLEFLLRDEDFPFVTSDSELKKFTVDSTLEMYQALSQGKHILFETDHGAKLCQHYGEYPKTTARTINASAFLGEARLPPQSIRDVYIVLKPYTTRVGPGPLEGEITDPKILQELFDKGGETGSMSGRFRRAGQFEWENVRQQIQGSGVTKIAITHLDISSKVWNALGYKKDNEFTDRIRKELCDFWPNPQVCMKSYGPKEEDVLFLKGD